MRICNKRHADPTPDGTGAFLFVWRSGRLLPAVLLFCFLAGTILTCDNGDGPTDPLRNGDYPIDSGPRVPGVSDKRFFGSWTRYDTINGQETLIFGTDSSVRIEELSDDPKYGGDPVAYRTGYWAVSLDTLLLSYVEFLYTGFGYLPVDTVRECAYNFRITDEYHLGLKVADSELNGSNEWVFYQPESDHPYQGMVRDSSRLNVVALVDTLYYPDDTARFEAFVFGPDTTDIRYIWSSPEDGVNGVVTRKGSYAKYFPLQQSRRHEWSVRAVNGQGEQSEPDYFTFDLPQFPPYVRMEDITLMCGEPVRIPVEAGDINGTVEMYYWQVRDNGYGTGYRDSSPEPFVTLDDTCQFSGNILVTVRDNHDLRSTAEFRLNVYPTLTIGSERNESPVALCETRSGDIIVAGTSAKEASLTSAGYVVKVSPEGAFMTADTFRVGHYLGGYGYNLPKSIIEGADDRIIVVGALDDSYSFTDSGFVVALDDELDVVWAKSIRDSGAKGGLLSAVVIANDGTIRAGGYSSTDSCTSEETGSGTVTSCRYIWNPCIAALDMNGNLLWQTTCYSYTIGYRQNMIQTPDCAIFASDSLVMNMDQEGTILDTYTLNSSAVTMVNLPDGNLAFMNSGNTQSSLEIRERDGQLVSSGTLDINRPQNMCCLENNNLVIVGDTKISCVSPDCATVWTREFDFARFTAAVGVRNGGVVVLGSTKEFGYGGVDIVLLKFSSDGTRIW
ncbi:MAG: hypothetical protein JW863_01275 [Chitinispirillaceae bacterium]|nr:hypothetical protein [Chitinispirillaceae bacterium]